MDFLVVLFLLALGMLLVGGVVVLVLARDRDSNAPTDESDADRAPPGTDPDHPCKGIVHEYWEYTPLPVNGMIQCIRFTDG